jgi:hypothetical protein
MNALVHAGAEMITVSPKAARRADRKKRRRIKSFASRQDADDGEFYRLTRIPHLVALLIMSYLNNLVCTEAVDALHFVCGPRLSAFRDTREVVEQRLRPRLERRLDSGMFWPAAYGARLLLDEFDVRELYLLFRWCRQPLLDSLHMPPQQKLDLELELVRTATNKIGFELFMSKVHAMDGRATWEQTKKAQRQKQRAVDDRDRFRNVQVHVVNTRKLPPVVAPLSALELKLDSDRKAQDAYFDNTTKEERHAHELAKQQRLMAQRKEQARKQLAVGTSFKRARDSKSARTRA